jgi:flagellar basal body-associated protein FliL
MFREGILSKNEIEPYNTKMEHGIRMRDGGASRKGDFLPRAARRGALVYRVLLGIAAALVLVLLAGTLYALAVHPDGAAPSPQTGQKSEGLSLGGRLSENGVFTGIGRIRASTAGPEPATVILSVTFPYLPEDKPFTEELASQIPNFRNTAHEYFSSFSTEELRKKDESAIKAEILRKYNLLLRLGQIETIYFNEYLVIE